MKQFLFSMLVVIACTQIACAQLKVTTLDKKDIPTSIKFIGHIINAVRYQDIEGDHLVITTETGKIPSKSKDMEDARDAELYAYHYKIIGNDYRLTWKTYDFEKDCTLDIYCSFLPNTVAVTDLNNDGKAEMWLMYKTACSGDPSPRVMKIIMHTGDMKYAIRGENKVVLSKQAMGGKYTFDKAFTDGPEVFRTYAATFGKRIF